MALADITDPDSIRKAAAEADRLGDDFLSTYGFRRARRYLVIVDGRRYDSKAIVGVAHGFQFPELGPLTWRDFSGGQGTVVKKLHSLGFEVLDESTAPRRRAAVKTGVTGRASNLPWDRRELVLTLDLYFRHRQSALSKTDPDIVALRDALSGPNIHPRRRRNATSIYMKIQNYKRLDPEHTSSGRSGLSRGGKLEVQIWDEFSDDHDRLRGAAGEILADLSRNFWVFQGHPRFFDVSAAVNEMSELTWLVRRHAQRIRRGDIAFVWEAGPRRGIVAITAVLEDPSLMESSAEELEFALDRTRFEGKKRRTRLQILRVIEPRIGPPRARNAWPRRLRGEQARPRYELRSAT